MRRVICGLKLSLVTFGVSALLTASAVCAYGQVTSVINYVPLSLGRGMWEGSCWTGSIAVARPDAWRCMAGNRILDPCFASNGARYAVCEPNPVTGDPGIRLKLTEPLPQVYVPPWPKTRDSAWLVELADGTTCRPVTGASWEVQGKYVSFYCESRAGGEEVDLLGGLNTRNPLWTAQKATISGDGLGQKLIKVQIIGVRRVWR